VPPAWTGFWWSVVRAGTAAAAAWVLPWFALPAAAALAVGWRARLAALVLLGCWMAARAGGWGAGLSIALALSLHIRVAGDPYGSWDRRGRPDPGTDWRFPFDAWLLSVIGSVVVGPGSHWLLAVPVGWIPPRRAAAPDLVEFDGECLLCSGFVRLLIAEGRGRFRFRGSAAGETVVVGPRMQSDAVLYLLERLGGLWRVLAWIARPVPLRVRDSVYRFIARHRPRSPGYCMVVPPHLAHLFEAEAR
jgi:predicted DCC family thiol-disulfide oxidoreductase YuxK